MRRIGGPHFSSLVFGLPHVRIYSFTFELRIWGTFLEIVQQSAGLKNLILPKLGAFDLTFFVAQLLSLYER